MDTIHWIEQDNTNWLSIRNPESEYIVEEVDKTTHEREELSPMKIALIIFVHKWQQKLVNNKKPVYCETVDRTG